MRRECLAIALTFLAAFGSDSWAESKQPSPSRGKDSQTVEAKSTKDQSPTASDQRGTKSQPIIVDVVKSAPDENERKTERDERDKKASSDWWLNFFTALLALFTFLLVAAAIAQIVIFVRQLRLIRDSLGPAEKAANAAASAAEAANLNAQAVIDSEQAYIFVNIQRSNMELFQQAATYEGPHDISAGKVGTIEIVFSIKNYGKTPAFFKELGYQIVIDVDFPTEPHYEFRRPIPVSLVLGAGETSSIISVSPKSVVTVAVAKDVYASKSSLWFYGFVSYDDAFGFGQELRYIWQYNGHTGGLRCISSRTIKSQKPHKE
jgi:hypothetical protein